MSFRARLLLGTLLVALLPLGGLAWLVREQMRETVVRLEEGRVVEDAARVQQGFDAAIADLRRRLDGLLQQLPQQNALRLVFQGLLPSSVLSAWPANVLSGTGLDALWLLNADGVILASGHAPADTGRAAQGWVTRPRGTPVVADLAIPDGSMRVLAMRDSVRLEGRTIHVVVGRRLDPVLAGLGRGPVAIAFREAPSDAAGTVRVIPVPVYRLGVWSGGAFVLARDPAELRTTLARLDRLFVLVGTLAVLLALVASLLLARGISAPLERLAERTGRLDLERLDVEFSPHRSDEIGLLERTLAALATRLKASVASLREVERRAAVGDMARQVNHDIKNGLVPIRNVLRHLVDTAERDPERTAAVLAERRGTLEASVSYLEQLAANYARLTPGVAGGPTDLGPIVRAAVDGARRDGLVFHTDVRDAVAVRGDPIAVRRVVENLVGNARDAARTAVTVTCAAEHGSVVMEVRDDGPGMTAEQLERAFAGFHTTKPGGTGLGLTVVRRLVQDLEGSLKVTTEPGRGTVVRVEWPAA